MAITYDKEIMYVSPDTNGRWHFLTSHTQVLLAIHRDPDVRLRDVATTRESLSVRPNGSSTTWSMPVM